MGIQSAIARLHESVSGQEPWIEALEALAASLGAAGCLFVSEQSRVTVPYSPIHDDLKGLVDAYFREGWFRNDETYSRGWPIIRSARRVVTDDDVSTPEERMRSPYYRNFRYRHGFRHWAAIDCTCSGGEGRAIALFRTGKQGEFTRTEVDSFARLSTQLTRIFSRALDLGAAQVVSCMDILERMNQPACLLGRTGGVMRMNRRAEALLDKDFFLRRGRLSAAHEQSRIRLEAMLDLASVAWADSSTAPILDMVRIERDRRRPLVLQAVPLEGKLPGIFSSAVALLLVNDLEKAAGPAPRMLRQVWGLSRCEAGIASELCIGKSLEEVAADLAISKETARKHLAAVFGKVGAHRQGELVALLNSVPKIVS